VFRERDFAGENAGFRCTRVVLLTLRGREFKSAVGTNRVTGGDDGTTLGTFFGGRFAAAVAFG